MKDIIVKRNQDVGLLLECGRGQRKISNKLNMTTLANRRVCCAIGTTIRQICSRTMMGIEWMHKWFPFQLHSYLSARSKIRATFSNQTLHFHSKSRKHSRNRRHGFDFSNCLGVRPDSLHERHRMWIHPFSLLWLITDCMRNLKVEPHKVANFFEQCNDLSIKVDLKEKWARCSIMYDLENVSRNRDLSL